MSGLVCPRCGRKSEKIDFIEAFCVDCYPADIKMPKKLEIKKCKSCGKVRISGEWIPYKNSRIAKYIIRKCKGNFDYAEYDPEERKIIFTIKENKKVERFVNIEFPIVMCTYCSRIRGGYYQAIIQLRGNHNRIEKYADMLVQKLSKKTFIAKEEEKHDGLDLYIGSSKAVIELLAELKIKALISRKLVGREEGKRLYRTTFLIRL